ncbi:kinase-like domain-containing protein [Suillus cothurnatus]|nr:kinase-like domain-containing protein [Suillus cothurnatus]
MSFDQTWDKTCIIISFISFFDILQMLGQNVRKMAEARTYFIFVVRIFFMLELQIHIMYLLEWAEWTQSRQTELIAFITIFRALDPKILGSVWLCRPKSSSLTSKYKNVEVAAKLVHCSKTSTTAARVRSLWNEIKIVRSFKADPHPSIIPFHSFIITLSYALITMAYLPTLVPVEFRSLLSGVHFLHERRVVHNDINYLSPERARGLPHDTRKSDIWSLLFEILVGRTPFEYEEGEQFASKADLEKYWGRTMGGKWVGSYTIRRPAEKLLKRMIVPNAD